MLYKIRHNSIPWLLLSTLRYQGVTIMHASPIFVEANYLNWTNFLINSKIVPIYYYVIVFIHMTFIIVIRILLYNSQTENRHIFTVDKLLVQKWISWNVYFLSMISLEVNILEKHYFHQYIGYIKQIIWYHFYIFWLKQLRDLRHFRFANNRAIVT